MELTRCIYDVYDGLRCKACEYKNQCLVRKAVAPKDKGPDSITNDFIYCRGEFDALLMTKHEIKVASEGYRKWVEKQRKDNDLQ